MQLAGVEIHEIALGVLRKRPHERLEEEIGVLMKWLRELSNRDARQGKVTVLGEIQDEVLREIVRGCRLEAFAPNQVLIKQGSVGNTMYIILTGMCDIRIASADTADDEDEEESGFAEGEVLKLKPPAVEALLGVSVGTFKAGHAFGEVALVHSMLRTASVIVNPESETCQVLVIDRQLFDRTLQDYMRREEAEKLEFIEQHSQFSAWPLKFRQQLLRGLTKTRFEFDEVVMRQADEIDCVYFITSGEVKMTMAPWLHRRQYSRLLGPRMEEKVFGVERRQLNERLQAGGQSCQWCCLAHNEIVGGLEVLLGMRTYICSGRATVRTNMLRLNLREWTRLVERRHPNTLMALKEDVLLRLCQRTLLPQTTEAPIVGFAIGSLYEQLRRQDRLQARRQRQQQQQQQQQGAPTLQLPKVGPLIDLWGPGTVFDYINRRFRRQQLREARAAALSGVDDVGGIEEATRRRQSELRRQQRQQQEPLQQHKDRCKLLRVLVQGFHDPGPQLGRPFLVREQLELVGIDRLEASVSSFCEQLRRPGDRPVAVPPLTRPHLLQPPREPRVAVLRPARPAASRRKLLKAPAAAAAASQPQLPSLLEPWPPAAAQ